MLTCERMVVGRGSSLAASKSSDAAEAESPEALAARPFRKRALCASALARPSAPSRPQPSRPQPSSGDDSSGRRMASTASARRAAASARGVAASLGGAPTGGAPTAEGDEPPERGSSSNDSRAAKMSRFWSAASTSGLRAALKSILRGPSRFGRPHAPSARSWIVKVSPGPSSILSRSKSSLLVVRPLPSSVSTSSPRMTSLRAHERQRSLCLVRENSI
mmetsp:Transcript_4344/g.13721  ORF Transcript_4344/g.13721 Transcript_4344/m.13721 type:complete len:219 (+) Transcript_4344:241-897(+)